MRSIIKVVFPDLYPNLYQLDLNLAADGQWNGAYDQFWGCTVFINC